MYEVHMNKFIAERERERAWGSVRVQSHNMTNCEVFNFLNVVVGQVQTGQSWQELLYS